MAGELMRATVKIPYKTGLPRDVSQNVLHFKLPALTNPDGAFFAHWNGIITNAYNNTSTSDTDDLSTYYASVIDRAVCAIDWAIVDLATGDVTPVVSTSNWIMKAGAINDSLPLEVAFCLSLEGLDPGGGPMIPKARRRGRVYFGPFNTAALGLTSSGGLPAPDAALAERARQWGALVVAGNDATFGNWVVYSRAGQAVYVVNGGWTDDEWDTQRRREADATGRTPWP